MEMELKDQNYNFLIWNITFFKEYNLKCTITQYIITGRLNVVEAEEKWANNRTLFYCLGKTIVDDNTLLLVRKGGFEFGEFIKENIVVQFEAFLRSRKTAPISLYRTGAGLSDSDSRCHCRQERVVKHVCDIVFSRHTAATQPPEVCSSPEQRGLLVSTEILIYSFYFLDYICNLLSWKRDFGCLISTANIVKGNTKAAENTCLPCLKLCPCCAGLIRDASGMNTWSEFPPFPTVQLHLFPHVLQQPSVSSMIKIH